MLLTTTPGPITPEEKGRACYYGILGWNPEVTDDPIEGGPTVIPPRMFEAEVEAIPYLF